MGKKRKGYKTKEQQIAATKRYLEKNVVAGVRAERSRLKSRCLKFINEEANLKELEKIKNIVEEKINKVQSMEDFEKLGTGWFPVKDDGVNVYLIALKKDVVIEPNTIHGGCITYLKENANCLTEQELRKFFLDKTGKELTTEELRKSSIYKKYLDELVILNFTYVNSEFIRTTCNLLKNF